MSVCSYLMHQQPVASGQTMPREAQDAFSDFMVALNEEQQVLLKAMYMLGAKDRERMLR